MNTKIMILSVIILPFVGSLGSWVLGIKSEKSRDYLNIAITTLNLFIVTMIFPSVKNGEINFQMSHFMGVGIDIKLDMLRYMFLWITTFIWALTTLYSTQYLTRYKNRNRYYAFFLLTLGATSGVFLAGDILGLLMFFELMSFTSYVLVIHDEDDNAHEAGRTYLTMAIIGGLLVLLGIFLLFETVEVLNLDKIAEMATGMGNIKYGISALLILGFGIKAGMFPLHTWLPKAHAAAPSPASAVLSGVLVKTGIFGIILTISMLLRDSHGIMIVLLAIGFITMFLGGFFALFQVNIKRILAYSTMSQMGYIIVGIGLMGMLKEDSTFALQGTIFHIFNHGIFKSFLFLCVGILYMCTHILDINELKGVGRRYPFLGGAFLIGVFAITGMPGFNGFISKSLLHEALAEAHHLYHSYWFTVGEWFFAISSAMTVAYMLKIFITVFIEREKEEVSFKKMEWTFRTVLPTVLLALIIVLIGVFPRFMYNLMGNMVELPGYKNYGLHDIAFFSKTNFKAVGLSYCIGALIYGLGIKKLLRNKAGDYFNPMANRLSLEKGIYIPIGRGIYKLGNKIFNFLEGITNGIYALLDNMTKIFKAFKQDKKPDKKEIILKPTDESGLLINGKFNGKLPSIERIVSFSEEFGVKANSITVSIYIFASMIIVILLAFILQNYNIVL